ncbi:MAG: hypothetical protein HC853_01925 [Anaerolineae bacterium]|nr:hypothetical protein [Anaerolineae bacterium]
MVRSMVATHLEDARIVFTVDGQQQETEPFTGDFVILVLSHKSNERPGVYEVGLSDAD